ncbi:MAG: effector binding domain-containing protein [Bacteroidota bacterium]
MNTIDIETRHIIGLSVRTTNENGQSATDIPALWNTFLSNNTAALIPNKIAEDLYCIYTDYESDHTKPYTTILGCQVSSLANIPEGLIGITINQDTYIPFVAKGKMSDNIVFKEWEKIWDTDLPRSYNADFEIYGPKAQNFEDAEVEIFISAS